MEIRNAGNKVRRIGNFVVSRQGRASSRDSNIPVTTKTSPLMDDKQEDPKVDISKLGPEEVESLKDSDPFLYYSIPEMRRKSYTTSGSDSSEGPIIAGGRDYTSKVVCCHANDEQGDVQAAVGPRALRRKSCPSEIIPQTKSSRSREIEGLVTRRRRVSTEAHLSIVMEDIMIALMEIKEDNNFDTLRLLMADDSDKED